MSENVPVEITALPEKRTQLLNATRQNKYSRCILILHSLLFFSH